MKAAVLREHNKPLEIEDVDAYQARPSRILVRPIAAGVCHSDLHFMDWLLPLYVAYYSQARKRGDSGGSRF